MRQEGPFLRAKYICHLGQYMLKILSVHVFRKITVFGTRHSDCKLSLPQKGVDSTSCTEKPTVTLSFERIRIRLAVNHFIKFPAGF